MYEYGISFKYVRYMQDYGSFHFCSRCVTFSFTNEEVLGAHELCRHSAMCHNPILCAVSPLSQNLYGQSLNDFHIFLARKYAPFGHSAYCRNHYGRLSHLREKYGKSTTKMLLILTSRQHQSSSNASLGPYNSP